ncbi:MAG: hypothetical protein JWN80_1719 [Microbacteriaceae bacterium]|nr:hypothetical protein [Microbacteriaceae bacterium]
MLPRWRRRALRSNWTVARFALACFLEPQPIGAEFALSELPLHVALIAGFGFDGDIESIVLPSSSAFELEAGDEELFGPEHDIPVRVFAEEGGIGSFHALVLAALYELGATIESPEYVGDGFRAHVTESMPNVPQPGDRVRLESMSLLQLAGGSARVIADAALGDA